VKMLANAVQSAQAKVQTLIASVSQNKFWLRDIEQVLQKSKRQLRNGNQQAVLQTLRAIKRKSINKAKKPMVTKKIIQTADILIEKITDEFLSKQGKMVAFNECASELISLVKKLLKQGQGPGPGPGPGQGSFVTLGETDYFSKSRFQTKVIDVQVKKKVSSLKITAKGDAIVVDKITVHFKNGRKQDIFNMSLSENSSEVVQLKSSIAISSISVTAKSAIIWGTKAKVSIKGK
jgi:hypothetical protein